jgi:hypothetical protein
MSQMDESLNADNPRSATFNNIEMGKNNVGNITIESGDSVEGALIKFLETNNDKLTEGGMGWDSDKYKDVHEWAGRRAHGLVQEFARANPSIDLNATQPGTILELDLSNPADVKVDIEFEGGPRIVSEGVKTEIPNETNVEVNSDENINEQTVNNVASAGVFGMTQEQYNQVSNKPVSEIIDVATGKQPEDWSQLERALLELSRPDSDIDITDKTVADVVNDVNIHIVDNVANANEETVIENMKKLTQEDMKEAFPGVDITKPPEIINGTYSSGEFAEFVLSSEIKFGVDGVPQDGESVREYANRMVNLESDAIDESLGHVTTEKQEISFENQTSEQVREQLMKNPEFHRAWTKQAQEVFGSSSPDKVKNIANVSLDTYLADSYTDENVQNRLKDVISRAQNVLGNDVSGRLVGAPGNNATVQGYFSRVFAEAVKQGKVKDIFPASDFSI